MRRLLVLMVLGLAPRMLPAAQAPAEVVTAEDLKAQGVICRRVPLQALTASVEIDVAVDESQSPGKYQGAECVVLKEAVPIDKLVAADAAAAEGGPVARKARSTKPNPVFLVLGRELPRAYLAFAFSVRGDAGATTRRYLLPVDAVRETPPPPAEPERDTPGPH